MNKKEPIILYDLIDREFLPFVRKPSRYIGGEINQVKKDLSACNLTVGLCFPDVYEVAMSNLGMAILYDIINSIPDAAAERIYAPWADAEKILRDKNIPLFSLESRASIRSFDVIGFSLTNELCCTNVLNIMDLGGMALRCKDRTDDDPIIIAGGSMANYCEPMADFIDLFVIGEAEEAIVQLTDLIKKAKQEGLTKTDTLLKAARSFTWVYVPDLYQVQYDGDGIQTIKAISKDVPEKLENCVVEDFENAPVPLKPIIPFTKAVHERVSIEIMRGCPGRCLFCQASFCRRPLRFRSVDGIFKSVCKAQQASGFDTISLLSLSSADYPHLEELALKLHEYFGDKHVGISLPSLRVDKQLKLLPALVSSVRKSGLTIAVESANEKIRDIVNKPLKDSDLFAAVQAAYQAGWQKLKLYFMVGLPGETPDDIRQIVRLSYELAVLRKKVDKKTANINVAVSWFVPKPHTPLQWCSQKNKQYFLDAVKIVLDEKNQLRARFLQFKFHDIDRSILEAAIGRGDRRTSAIIESAWRNGCRFDLWDECFNYDPWISAFKDADVNVDSCAQKKFNTEQTLPWQHLGGPEKKYLLDHYNKAMEKTETCD